MTSQRTVMIALGGNALSNKSEAGTITQQFAHTKKSLRGVMHFVRAGYNICITHGNGPQVGAELSRNEIAAEKIPPLPLGVLVANTQGAMGYMIQQSLQNALYNEDSKREVVSFISQMKVDQNDPAIRYSTKFIGQSFTKEKAHKYMDEYGFEKFKYNTDLRRILTYPRMIQRWNMFSPTVLGTDKTVIIEATLINGDIVNPFTGEAPILDNLDYLDLYLLL